VRAGEEWCVAQGNVEIAGGAYPGMRVTIKNPKGGFMPVDLVKLLESLANARLEALSYWHQYQVEEP
jgi:hypothetical protein